MGRPAGVPAGRMPAGGRARRSRRAGGRAAPPRRNPRGNCRDRRRLRLHLRHLVADQVDEPGEVGIRTTGSAIMCRRGGPARRGSPRRRHPHRGRRQRPDGRRARADARSHRPAACRGESLEQEVDAVSIDFTALMNVDYPATCNRAGRWRTERGFLRVPIGLDETGEPATLDLKESAQLGMGRMARRTTAWGKSEMLRTLVLVLLPRSAPRPGQHYAGRLQGRCPPSFLPAPAGMSRALSPTWTTTPLSSSGLISKACWWRSSADQQVLKDAGNIANIGDYTFRRRYEPSLPPLLAPPRTPSMSSPPYCPRPDFIELFWSIGRIGRSIGVHGAVESADRGRQAARPRHHRLDPRGPARPSLRKRADHPRYPYALPPPHAAGLRRPEVGGATIYQRFKAGYLPRLHRGPVAIVEETDVLATPALLDPPCTPSV